MATATQLRTAQRAYDKALAKLKAEEAAVAVARKAVLAAQVALDALAHPVAPSPVPIPQPAPASVPAAPVADFTSLPVDMLGPQSLDVLFARDGFQRRENGGLWMTKKWGGTEGEKRLQPDSAAGFTDRTLDPALDPFSCPASSPLRMFTGVVTPSLKAKLPAEITDRPYFAGMISTARSTGAKPGDWNGRWPASWGPEPAANPAEPHWETRGNVYIEVRAMTPGIAGQWLAACLYSYAGWALHEVDIVETPFGRTPTGASHDWIDPREDIPILPQSADRLPRYDGVMVDYGLLWTPDHTLRWYHNRRLVGVGKPRLSTGFGVEPMYLLIASQIAPNAGMGGPLAVADASKLTLTIESVKAWSLR